MPPTNYLPIYNILRFLLPYFLFYILIISNSSIPFALATYFAIHDVISHTLLIKKVKKNKIKICSFCLLAFVANSNLLIQIHGQWALFIHCLCCLPLYHPLSSFSLVPLALLSVFNSQIRRDSLVGGFN